MRHDKPAHIEKVDAVPVELADQLARALAARRPRQETPSLPGLFGAASVDALNVAQRWHTNDPSRELRVPLGTDAQGQLVTLDLREHALISGSGRSSLLQTLVAAVAVQFHPRDMQVRLVDGGALDGLPHVVSAQTAHDVVKWLEAEIGRRSAENHVMVIVASDDPVLSRATARLLPEASTARLHIVLVSAVDKLSLPDSCARISVTADGQGCLQASTSAAPTRFTAAANASSVVEIDLDGTRHVLNNDIDAQLVALVHRVADELAI
jgi:DNA segregation ATPase FtsK/SpoIIIE-like protein